MALVFTPDQSGDSALNVALASGWHLVGGSGVFSGSYASGGETLDLAKMFGSGGSLRRVIPIGNIRGMLPEYDKVNKKLKLFVGTAPATVAEHTAAAYDADITATAIDMAFFVKFG
jgi:hypothetical protein